MNKLDIVKNRIYADYFMPSRLNEYERVIKRVIDSDYEIITIRDYYNRVKNGTLNSQRYFINRHDIDTDISTAKEFFNIEKRYGVKSTYYFRLSTLDFKFMREIEEHGGEASYHFEEIATYCKEKHIRDRDLALDRLPEIKEIFKRNFLYIEKEVGRKLESVCSHGDFLNRELKIINNEITKDNKLRQELGIKCEAYDEDIMNSFDIYLSDRPYPIFYYPKSIFKAIGEENIICMLSHPRHWRRNWIVNTTDNIKRLYEGLIFYRGLK